MSAQWNAWLNEVVEWEMEGELTRRRAIMRLVNYGLAPFLKENGYVIYNTNHLTSGVARILYENAGLSCLDTYSGGKNAQEEYPEEHMHRYYYVLSEDKWSKFWEAWAAWSDLDDSSGRGWDRRIELQNYCWTQIDLEKSPQRQVVDEFLYFDENAPRQDFITEDA